MEDSYIDPMFNIPIVDLPVAVEERFGLSQFDTVMQLQVGFATNEANPKVMRVNQSGQWMGQQKFVPIANEPTNTAPIKYQVDMLGNITATSFKTAGSGERIRIFQKQLEVFDSSNNKVVVLDDLGLRFYDPSNILRMFLTKNAIEFYNSSGVQEGQIFGSASGGGSLFVEGLTAVALATNTTIHGLLDNATLTTGWFVPFICFDAFQVAQLSSAPSGVNGTMYYDTATDELRVLKGGTWRDVITT